MEGWRNLRLTNVKQNALIKAPLVLKEIRRQERLLLLELVVIDKLVNKKALRNIMMGVWQLQGKHILKKLVTTSS